MDVQSEMYRLVKQINARFPTFTNRMALID